MFSSWGDFAYRHRRVVPVAIIAAILLLYGLFGLRLADRMSQEGWDDPGSSSTQAAEIEEETFGRDNSGDVILMFKDEAGIATSQQFAAISDYLKSLQADHPDQIASVTSYFDKRNPNLVSQDGKTAFAAVALKGDDEQTLKDFRAIKPDLSPTFDGISVETAGATAVADALDEGMAGDIHRAEIYALPAVAVLLLIVFGSVVAAFMPLIVGGLSILGSLGVLSVLAGVVQVNVFAQSVVTLLGLGLAIDYGLFMVSRFREELDQGREVREAVRITTATAGKTVVFSAGMVVVALSGLLVFPQAFLKSVAYGAISAVSLAAILSITVLPSLFGLLGRRIDALTIRKTSRVGKRLEDTWWYRLPQWAMKHAKVVTVALVAGLILLALPLAGVKFGGINETYLPPTNQVRQAQASFDEQFPNFRTEPIKLVVTGADNAQLVDVFTQANQVQGLTGRFQASSETKDGTTVLSAGIANREDNEAVVKQLRAIQVPEGVNVYIGGTPALEVESIEALFNKLPTMALYIVIATFLLMSLVFGSMILPAKAVIMTILGMGATLGILTAMFVDGVGASLANFTPGPLMSPVLVLIMAIVYGLSTDYEVFLVSRMVEARENGETTDESIKYGTAHTGGIITAAALIMIVVCGAFGFSEIVMMKYIAFGMIFALLFDATVIRMLLVPAVMHLLRDDNWWAPRWVKAASAKMGHHHAPAPAEAAAEVVASEELLPEPAVAVAAQPRAEAEGVDKQGALPRYQKPLRDGTYHASHAAPEPDNAEAVPAETPIDQATPIERNVASRGGRIASDDNELVPFSELLKRLNEEKRH